MNKIERIKELYEELRGIWPELPFLSIMRVYRQGAYDARVEQMLGVEQARKDLQGKFPQGSTLQQGALFRAMYGPVIRGLVPDEGVEEDVFRGMHPPTVRKAIANLAVSLLSHAVEDIEFVEENTDEIWGKLIDEICDEMRATIRSHVPVPERH